MARSATHHGYGTSCFVYQNYDPPGGADAFAATANPFTELRSATYTGGNHAEIDVTHLLSPAGAKEMQPGFLEGGQFELKFNYTPALWSNLNANFTPDLVDDTGPAWGRRRITLDDPLGNYLTARVKFSIPTKETGEDGGQTISVTLKVVEGRVTYTAAA